MSFDFNYKFWVSTKNEIDKLIKRQNALKRREPIEKPLISFRILSELYLLYVDLASKLGYLYQHTFQVQKRAVVKNLIGPILRNLMLLKNELKRLEISEFVYMDNVLVARKLTPFNIVVWRSPDFLFRRPYEIQNIIYDHLLDVEEAAKSREIEQKASIIQAIILIQMHERARQARVYRASVKFSLSYMKKRGSARIKYTFGFKKDQSLSVPIKRTFFTGNSMNNSGSCQILNQKENIRKSSKRDAEIFQLATKRKNAAITIQSAWRIYSAKRELLKLQQERKCLYGLRKTRKLKEPLARILPILDTYKNELLKHKLDDDYVKLITDERTRLMQERAPHIMEDISDHIREWFRQFYEKTDNFHPYPEVAKNGTIMVLLDESMTFDEFKEYEKFMALSKDERKARLEKQKLQKQKAKDKIKKEKIKLAKRRKKYRDAGILDIADLLQDNADNELVEKTMDQFSTDWKHIDEFLNKAHIAHKEWVTNDQLAIIHQELRLLVDEFMRLEYELLKSAWALDNKKPYKAPKPKKEKAKKAKRKKKKAKGLGEDRSIESFYDELVTFGIIEKHADKSLKDFIGDFNFLADEMRDEERLVVAQPAKADIKFVIEDCLMGFGDIKMDRPKSMCIIGPPNSGKKFMCDIIASEIDALLMNLSPEKTYTFSDRLNYFVQVVLKVAKAFQPTILFVNNAHRVFYKKTPKEEQSIKPTMLQGALSKKILKSIGKDDRILLLGTSDLPWAANAKFTKTFQKIYLMPKPDYGTTFLLWLELIGEYINHDEREDYVCSALTKMLCQYNSGDIIDNVSNTLNLRRKMRLNLKALTAREFLDYFLQRKEPLFPPTPEMLQTYDKWYAKQNEFLKIRTKKIMEKLARAKKK